MLHHWYNRHHYKSGIAGIGLGLVLAAVIFYYWDEVSALSSIKIGVIGLLTFMIAKHKKGSHHGYVHHGHHEKHN